MTKDALGRTAAKCLAAEAVLYALACAAVYAVFGALQSQGAAGTATLSAMATLLLLDAAGCLFCLRLARRGGKSLLGFYLLSKVVKLFVAIAAVTLYGVLSVPGLLSFAVIVFVFYVIGLSSTSVFYALVERHLKNK